MFLYRREVECCKEAELFCGGSLSCCFLSCGCFCLSFGSCFSFSLSGSDFSFFLSYDLSFCLVLSLLGLKTCFSVESFFVGHRRLDGVNGSLFFAFPGIETTLSFSFVKSTFLYTALEMFHQQNALVREDSTYGVGRLCADIDPIQSPFEIQSYCSRISVRIIRTYPFNKFTISWCSAIGDYNRIKRVVLATVAL